MRLTNVQEARKVLLMNYRLAVPQEEDADKRHKAVPGSINAAAQSHGHIGQFAASEYGPPLALPGPPGGRLGRIVITPFPPSKI